MFYSPRLQLYVNNSRIGPFTLAKTQNPKNLGFIVVPFTLPSKMSRITFGVHWHWKATMREKTPNLILASFGKWCAWATSLYLWPYTCSAHYVAGRGRVIPSEGDSKTRIILARLERAFTLAKKLWNFGGVSKNHAAEVGFSIRVFEECLGRSCLATFNEKPECEKDSGFFMAMCKTGHFMLCSIAVSFALNTHVYHVNCL